MLHVKLPVLDAPKGGVEEVEVEPLGGDRYRILCPPRFVDGLAMDDVIELDGAVPARFRVVHRSGKLTIRFYVKQRGDECELARVAAEALDRLGVVLEGTPPGMMIVTASIAVGWERIAAAMDAICAMAPGTVWEYANVYDHGTGKPLDWWKTQ